MTQNIYYQHKAAFPYVSAYAIVGKKGERVGSIAFKFPRDGAGRLWVYLHIFGVTMVRGMAGGYGYDKQSAAMADAGSKAVKTIAGYTDQDKKDYPLTVKHVTNICKALDIGGSGADWQRELERAGYRVYGAV